MKILASLIFATGLIFFCYWVYAFFRCWQVKVYWKRIEATFSSVEIQKVKDDGEDIYYPDVEYQYNLNGQAYTGNRVSFSDNLGFNTTEVKKLGINELHVGGKRTVYYCQKDPSKSVIYSDISSNSLGAIIFSAILFGFSYVMFNYW